MSYAFAYYVAYAIEAFRGLSWWLTLVCFPVALALSLFANHLETAQKGEEVRHLIDWTASRKYYKRALWVILMAPVLYMISHVLPDARTAMIHMGFPQDDPCMAEGESGKLIEGRSTNDIFYASFVMENGVAIMCRIDDMRADAAKKDVRYSVPRGRRVS